MREYLPFQFVSRNDRFGFGSSFFGCGGLRPLRPSGIDASGGAVGELDNAHADLPNNALAAVAIFGTQWRRGGKRVRVCAFELGGIVIIAASPAIPAWGNPLARSLRLRDIP